MTKSLFVEEFSVQRFQALTRTCREAGGKIAEEDRNGLTVEGRISRPEIFTVASAAGKMLTVGEECEQTAGQTRPQSAASRSETGCTDLSPPDKQNSHQTYKQRDLCM